MHAPSILKSLVKWVTAFKFPIFAAIRISSIMPTTDKGGGNLFSFALFKQLCVYPAHHFNVETHNECLQDFSAFIKIIGRGNSGRMPELARHPGNCIVPERSEGY